MISQINEHIQVLDFTCKDSTIENNLKNYFELIYSETDPINEMHFAQVVNCFANVSLEDLGWDSICKQIFEITHGNIYLLGFYEFLLSKNVTLGQYSNYLNENRWIFSLNNIAYSAKKRIFFEGSNPYNIFIFGEGEKRQLLYLNINNDDLRDIVIGFLNYRLTIVKSSKPLQPFVYQFEESLKELDALPTTYECFNYKIFVIQYSFYKNKEFEEYNLINLKNFYMFLIQALESQRSNHKVFDDFCGIDKNFIHRFDFYKLFKKGYKVILLNKSDNIPVEDRWLLNPNGYEENTTAINSSEYMPLDFTRVYNNEMRYELKKWFFYSNKGLKSLRNDINNIFLFFEFIEGPIIKEMKGNLDDFYGIKNSKIYHSLISEENILLFIQYLKRKFDSQYTINAYISATSSFLKYIDSKKKYNINPKVFEYLRIKIPRELKGKSIIKEDLEKIAAKLKDNMNNGNTLDKLLWVFFHLSITTNFRPSEILNLKRDCIIEGMKTGDYVITTEARDKIKMTTKVSVGQSIEVNPTEYTIRSIREAIKLTKDLADEASDEVKRYIFIRKSNKVLIEPIKLDIFYRRFKKIIKELDLIEEDYTIYNCRHTYMTTLFEEAMKGGNLDKALIASGHKDITTTIKHYIRPEIKSYLEALHKVKIGNVTINGEVVENLEDTNINIPNDVREITVKDGCGFCKGNCSINENVDCLICRNFVVTIDRIPFFEQSIKKLDKVINNEEILHEKEHLVSIKKLYVGYLAALYTYKS